jgi:ppGpp synthetase/RelA/SpoT-type nucleotidyltranferase
MNDDRIELMIEEYNHNLELYKDFCSTVVFLLKKLLKSSTLQYQVVSSRVKGENSLRTKLLETKSLSSLTSITELDDVVGCRVIFYLESEIEKFINLIYKEFQVVKNNLRYTEDDYNAHHLIISFKEERLNLTEYAQFKDLKCELQLTTVLFHAWSEVSHNITYKTPKDIVEFDAEKIDFLKAQLKEIMKNYIKPANFKFEFINKEYLYLLEGKEIFSTNFLNDIIRSEDRREIYTKLLLLGQYLKKYGDKTPSEFKLPDFMKMVINRSLKLAKNPPILGFGYEHHYIVTECIEILCGIRYQYPEQVFPVLVELALDKNKVIKDKAIDAIKQMSKYNSKILEKIGLSMQCFMLDQIKNWNHDEQIRRIEIIKWILKEIFKLEYESTEMIDYKTFSFGFGLLLAAETIKRIREQSIQLLITLYEGAVKTSDKLIILDVLQEATKTPNRGNYSEEVETLVKENTTFIVSWYSTIIEQDAALEVMKEIDEQSNWFARRFESVDGLSTLGKQINSNDRYTIYKDLVGYDSDYLEKLDWRMSREIRTGKIKQYIENISEETEDYWTALIVNICAGYTIHDQGKYTYFSKFLYGLACKRPEFVQSLILKHEEDIKVFLHHIIAGLKTSDYMFAHQKMEQWIESGIHLINCVLSCLYSDTVDIEILESIFDKASKNKESHVLHELFRILNTSKIDKMMSKCLYIKVMSELSNMNDYWWTNYVWLDEDSILNKFDENEHDQILDILKKCPQIDYHVGQMLIPIANITPKKVINFFESRLNIRENEKEIITQYDAIPFHLNELGEALKNNSEICIPLIFEWFKKDHWLFKYEASDLLQKLFPSFDEPIESFFLCILENKNVEEAKVILEVLSKYDGDLSIYNFSQQFVIAFQDKPNLLQQLMYVLSKTGGVTGEYGYVEALKQTKKEIKKWNKSKNEAVRKFVKDFVDYLNSSITAEKKRSDERVQLMHHEFEFKPK